MKNVPLVAVLAALFAAACSQNPDEAKEAHLRRGQAYAKEKKFHEATLEFSRALQLDRDYGEAEVGLGDAYAELGDRPKAAAAFARAADLLPDDLDLQLRAGSMRLMAGSYEDAKVLADKVIAKQPTNLVALLLKANALAGIDGVETAVQQIQAALALDPQRAEIYTNLGAIQAAGNRRAEAEAAFKKAVEIAPREARAHSALANFYWAARRQQEAEKSFLDALAIDPSNLSANDTLATFYLATGRPLLAERFLKAVADGAPGVDAQVRLADYYLLYRKSEDGLAILNEIAKRPDGFAPATTRLAARAYAQGNREEGHRLVGEILRQHPRDAPTLQLLAHFLFMENRLSEALVKARAAVQANPQLESAHYLIARIQVAVGNVPEAIVELKTVQKINPRASAALVLLAQLQSEAGYPELAVSLATSAVSSSGGAPEMRLALVRLLFAKGDLARASTELASLRKILPAAAPVLTVTGELHLLKREFPAARTAFEAALLKDPASLEALTGLVAVDVVSGRADAARTRVEAELSKAPNRTGVQLLAAKVYGAQRDFPKAEAMMKTAIAGNPSSMEAYGMLGQFLYQHGRLEEGRQEFEKLTKQQPRNVSALTMLAIIERRLGDRDEAMRRYDEILAIDSEAGVAANNLAWMLVEQDRELDRAVQLATIAVHRLPGEPGVADTLGWAYVKRGMASFGLPHLITIVQRHPQDPTFRYHLGAAYVQMKEPLKARAELQQALNLSSSFPGADDARRLLESLK